MDWGEAWRLYECLSNDPTSQIAAAQAGWDYPFSREAMVSADLFDLTYQANSSKTPKPYPRPWPDADKEKSQYGKTSLDPAKVRALLARRGIASIPPPEPRKRDQRGRFLKE